MRARVALAIVGLALAACGSETAPPPAPPEDAVQGLRAATAIALASDDVAAEAIDPIKLQTVLDEAGFESAIQRTFARPRGSIRRVDVRVVRFSTEDGAQRYLAWLQDHVEDVIGDADPATELQVPRATLFLHLPSGCCPKETPIVLAAWRDGLDVVRVLVAGPGADGRAATGFVTEVERWWEGS